MTWLLALTGPSAFAATWLLGQTGSTGLTEALVAFGVITGLSGAVVKLWSELARLQRKIEETADANMTRTLPVVGEAIAEVRETRRERQELRVVLEQTNALLASVQSELRRRK